MCWLLQAQEWYREDLVSAALQRSGVARGNVFLTSKLHPRHHGTVSASRQLNQARPAFLITHTMEWH